MAFIVFDDLFIIFNMSALRVQTKEESQLKGGNKVECKKCSAKGTLLNAARGCITAAPERMVPCEYDCGLWVVHGMLILKHRWQLDHRVSYDYLRVSCGNGFGHQPKTKTNR